MPAKTRANHMRWVAAVGALASCLLLAGSLGAGSANASRATASQGHFKAVTAGGEHTCAIRTDDLVACWGLNNKGQASPPSDAFKAIDAGYDHTCGIRIDDSVTCWGSNTYGQAPQVVEGKFKAISGGEYFTVLRTAR